MRTVVPTGAVRRVWNCRVWGDLHPAAGDNLLPLPEPRHLGPRAAADGRQAEDGRAAFRDHSALVCIREVSHICRGKPDF